MDTTHSSQVRKRMLVDDLFTAAPRFHGGTDAGTKDYAISRGVCQWLFDSIPAGARGLETGCGYSTVVLAHVTQQHTVISPFSGEHLLIQQWCHENGVSTEHVTFLAEPSQIALPKRTHAPVDVALIDGDHSFPVPMIDWYYIAEDIRPNGFLLVDDMHIVSGRILHDFLLAEKGRWKLERQIGKTSVFRRVTTGPVIKGIWWGQQPYNRDLTSNPTGLVARALHRTGKAVLNQLPAGLQDFARRQFRRK